jgi:hypothetical protein
MGDSPAVLTSEKKPLTKEERSQIAKDAAKRRWAKAKREKGKVVKSKAATRNAKSAKKKPSSPREFVSALKTAEKRLVKAIQERAEAGAKYAVVSAEIPSLQRLIAALRNPLGGVSGYDPAQAPISLEQIVGDQPLPYANPPRAVPAPVPAIPVPQQLHPANQQGRAQGGAIGVELAEEQDEDAFLKGSAVAGGEWH